MRPESSFVFFPSRAPLLSHLSVYFRARSCPHGKRTHKPTRPAS